MDDADKKVVPARPGADLSGRRLGGYRLLRRLGRGAMAEVYLAEQISLKRQVAVKVLKSQFVDDRTSIQRFQREAEAAAALVHAHIVQIHEVGCVDGIHFIAQEYVQGQNLRQWMSKNGLPDLAVALGIMRQAAAALAKAAEQGIVHRDIKPENILITRAGEVKVADFGLARRSEPGKGVDLTQVGITMGTPLYMSPEQAEGKPLDPRSDLYSLGVTFYHLLGGEPPFLGESALAVAVQHIKSDPPPLEKLRPDLPRELCRLVHRMLAKNPQNRYPSAEELLGDLRQLQLKTLGHPWPEELSHLKQAAPETGEIAPSPDATQRLQSLMRTASFPSRRHGRRWAWTVAGLAAFVLGGLLAFFVTRQPPLLADAAIGGPSIPKRETALRQWMDATELGTEAAWQAVIDYWPNNTNLVNRAQGQLARIYLQEGDYEKALLLFQKLANLPEIESELRAFGLAGQCGVLSLQGHCRESDAVLNELWPLREKLHDPQMQRLLQHAIAKNRSKSGNPTTQEWDSWLADQFGAPSVDDPSSME